MLNYVSTIERYHLQNGARSAEKPVWAHGMRLAKGNIVKRGYSYRGIILGVGIAVALIVILTFLASRKGTAVTAAAHVTSLVSAINEIPSFDEILWKASQIEF
jgi:hypothetical protein